MTVRPWTFVSAYLADVNARSTDDYVRLGEALIEAPVPKVLFVDERLRNRFEVDRPDTHFVWTRFEDLYLSRYETSVTPQIQTPTPTKDTLRYLMVQCHKTEWLDRATELNPFGSTSFVWTDISIGKFFKDKQDLWSSMVPMTAREVNLIRMPSIWPTPVRADDATLRRTIQWYFAGGVFGGPTAAVREFASVMRRACLEAVADGWLTWEVNLWAMIHRTRPDLFDLYPSDHNRSLLESF